MNFASLCSKCHDLSVTLALKVSPGLQDLQKQGQRILAEKRAEEAEENTWIGQSGRESHRIRWTHQITCHSEISVLIAGSDMIG